MPVFWTDNRGDEKIVICPECGSENIEEGPDFNRFYCHDCHFMFDENEVDAMFRESDAEQSQRLWELLNDR